MIKERAHCDCGRPASVRHGNAFICEHCHRIELSTRQRGGWLFTNTKQPREVNYYKVHLPNHPARMLVTLWFFAFALGSIGVCALIVLRHFV